MKRNLLSIAVGALFAAGAGSAFALSPTATNAVAADHQIRMSGATAQDPGLLNIMRRSCTAGSLNAFVYTGANAQTIYSCTLSAPMTDGSNSISGNVVFFKDSAVGSQNGVSPFTTGGAGIQYASLALSGANFSGCTSPTTTTVATSTSAPTLIAYTNFACGGAPVLNSAVTPDIGFADVEPKIFGYPASEPTGASVASANQIMFGVPVSLALYNYLQSAQGLTVTTTADSANRPTLSDSQIAGLYSGLLTNASDLGTNNTATYTVPASAGTSIYVARRVDTSGSQKSAEVNFLQQNIITPPPTSFSAADRSGATSTSAPVTTTPVSTAQTTSFGKQHLPRSWFRVRPGFQVRPTAIVFLPVMVRAMCVTASPSMVPTALPLVCCRWSRTSQARTGVGSRSMA
jgi:hypothetical protein